MVMGRSWVHHPERMVRDWKEEIKSKRNPKLEIFQCPNERMIQITFLLHIFGAGDVSLTRKFMNALPDPRMRKTSWITSQLIENTSIGKIERPDMWASKGEVYYGGWRVRYQQSDQFSISLYNQKKEQEISTFIRVKDFSERVSGTEIKKPDKTWPEEIKYLYRVAKDLEPSFKKEDYRLK
jgi:hypothetical protein